MDNINFGMLLTVIFGLMAATNVIVEVVKKVTWGKLPTNIVVVLIAEALTLAAGGAYAELNGIAIKWYMDAGGAVVGLFVAYAAMFGFDKLKQAFEQGGGNTKQTKTTAKKVVATMLALVLVMGMTAAPASAITTGKWELSQGTQDLIDKTLNEVPEYQPEPEKPDCPAHHWAEAIQHIMRYWFDHWDRWDVSAHE